MMLDPDYLFIVFAFVHSKKKKSIELAELGGNVGWWCGGKEVQQIISYKQGIIANYHYT